MTALSGLAGWHRAWPCLGVLLAGWRRVCPCLGVLLVLAGCSDDAGELTPQHITVELQPCSQSFLDVQPISGMSRTGNATRSYIAPAWVPSGYYTYDYFFEEGTDHGSFAMQKNLVNKSITTFFTQNGASPMEGTFFYFESATPRWRLDMEIESAGTYYLYGCMPTEDFTSASVASADYSEGAVLTINGLNSVTPSDVCVIVGAKEGTGETTVSGLQTGQFATALRAVQTTTTTEHNYIFLLFDHIYSSLRFRFTVAAGYDQLRTIKLRRLELRAGGTTIKSKYNAEVILKEGVGIENIIFTGAEGSSGSEFNTIFAPSTPSTEATLTSGQYTDFMGCFVPGQEFYQFDLRSTYDVYDKQGNLIREGCQAVNSFNLRDIFGENTVLRRGHTYSVSLTVNPTYLYVLSEPDLDNPTVSLQ